MIVSVVFLVNFLAIFFEMSSFVGHFGPNIHLRHSRHVLWFTLLLASAVLGKLKNKTLRGESSIHRRYTRDELNTFNRSYFVRQSIDGP